MTQFLTLAEQNSYLACVVALLFSAAIADKRWFVFNLITCLSFSVAMLLDGPVKSADPQLVWRYLFWVVNDCAWFLIIAHFWSKGRIYNHQVVIAGFITIALVTLNLFRFIDRQFFDLSYSIEIYKPFYPAITLLIVLLCWLPAVTKLRSKN